MSGVTTTTFASLHDVELCSYAAAGERRAFGELVRRHGSAVRHLLRRMGAQAAESDDVAQDAFLAAFERIAEFRGEGTFEDTLALLGFAVALPTLLSLIPDGIRAALTTLGLQDRRAWEAAVALPGTADWWFLWTYMAAYVVGLLGLFPLAVAAAHRLRCRPAVAVGLVGAVLYQGVYLIFVR